MAASVLLTGCHVPGFATRQAADKQGRLAENLWHGTEFVALVVGGLVWGLILFVVIRYRRRRSTPDDVIPSQRAYIIPLEVFYSIVPLVVVAVLFGFTVVDGELESSYFLPARIWYAPETETRFVAFDWVAANKVKDSVIERWNRMTRR